jgi:MYXO-CTERM domain-containing protein
MSSNRIGPRLAPAIAAGLLAVSIGASAQAAVVPGEIVLQTGEEWLGQDGILVTALEQPFVTGNQVGFAFQVADATLHVWSGDGSVFDNNLLVEGWLVLGSGYSAVVGVSGPTGYVLAPQISNGGSPLDAVISHVGILAMEGEVPPTLPFGEIVGVFDARMDEDGDAYFIASADDDGNGSIDRQLFYRAADGDPANLQILMSTGDGIDVPSGIFFIEYPIAATGVLAGYAVSEDGTNRAHRLRLSGPPTTSDEVVWADGTVLAQEGTLANPGGNGSWTSFSNLGINDAGNVLFSGNTDAASTSDEFITYDGDIVLAEGATVDGVTLTTPSTVLNVSLNDWGQATHSWSHSGEQSLFFACDASDLPGTSQLVAQLGDGFDEDGDGDQDATILAFDTQPADGLSEDYGVYAYIALDTDPIELAIARFEVTCCGNGLPDALEGCDDGNVFDTDACLTTCVPASCGDGFVWATVEACDDANAFDGDACLSTCVEATCGDGVVWEGMEACDDGNADDTDACLTTCVAASCGDGIVQEGVEECDDANQYDDDDCTNRCTTPVSPATAGKDTGDSSSGDETSAGDSTGSPGDTGTPDGTGGPDDTAGPDGTGSPDPTATGGPGSDGSGTDASDTDGAGATDDGGGCACAAGSDRMPLHLALFGLVLALRRGRRRTPAVRG